MDNNTPSPQRPAPGPQPGAPHRPMQPVARRPLMVDGFAPRRPMQPAPGMAPARPVQLHPAGQPSAVPAPQPQPLARPQAPGAPGLTAAPHVSPTAPAPTPAPQPHPAGPAAVHRPVHPDFAPSPRPAAPVAMPAPEQPGSAAGNVPISTNRPGREKTRTGHAGLVGFIVFILLGTLLLSPFVPGKIMDSFPFTSSNFSTGNQSLDCIGTQGKMSSATQYNSRAGAPITYAYATSMTQTATCNGQVQRAVAGHTSQFNPLGLVADIVTALVAAIIVATIWRLIFRVRKHTPHRREN